MPLCHPRRDRAVHLIELSGEKMIRVFHHDDPILSRQRCDQLSQLSRISKLVVAPLHKQFWLFTSRQVREVGIVHRRSQPDQRSYSGVLAAGLKPDPAPKTESRDEERNVWEFHSEKIQCDANIAAFPFAAIVLPLALSGPAKIETQNGQAKRIERFGGLIDHLVVHRAAEKGVRVANNRGQRRSTRAGAPQNGFQAPSGPR